MAMTYNDVSTVDTVIIHAHHACISILTYLWSSSSSSYVIATIKFCIIMEREFLVLGF
jgi:hypothetical protein